MTGLLGTSFKRAFMNFWQEVESSKFGIFNKKIIESVTRQVTTQLALVKTFESFGTSSYTSLLSVVYMLPSNNLLCPRYQQQNLCQSALYNDGGVIL